MIPEIISIRHDDGSGFRAEWVDNESSFLHVHPEYEIVLNITGNGTRVAGDSVEILTAMTLLFTVLISGTSGTFTGRMTMTGAIMPSCVISDANRLESHCCRSLRRCSCGVCLMSRPEVSLLQQRQGWLLKNQ